MPVCARAQQTRVGGYAELDEWAPEGVPRHVAGVVQGERLGFHPSKVGSIPIARSKRRRGRLVRHVLAMHVQVGSIPIVCSEARESF